MHRKKEQNKMNPIIETKNLTYSYGVGTPFEHKALDSVNFSASKGEYVAVIGRTGSGKSTLIQHLNGLKEPTSGSVLLDGQDIFASKESLRGVRFKVGLVFQYPEYQLFEETVYKDVAFGPKNMGLGEKETERRVRESLELVGMGSEYLEASPFDLSGGQKRRVAIAGVMAMQPRVLILDEPAAGLDPAGSEEISRNIRDYRERTGATIIAVTHDMTFAASQADRVFVLCDGREAMSGTPESVFARSGELERLGLAIPEITRITDLLREKGLDLPRGIYTLTQAKEAILALRGGAENA